MSNKSLYAASVNRKPLPSSKLLQNLLTIISEGDVRAQEVAHEINELFYLVGQTIFHTFEAEGTEANDSVQHETYRGRVIGQVKGFPDWFNVEYDDDDDLYVFNLKEDLENGNLKVANESSDVDSIDYGNPSTVDDIEGSDDEDD